MGGDCKGWGRPRPIRVAFLVVNDEHAHLQLDGIFADCYARWGGRFSLIVPCSNGGVPDAYWSWLEAYDPDVVYSYAPLTREQILELHERLSIGEYRYHWQGPTGLGHRLDVHGFKPRYDFRPLSSMSVVFRLSRYRSPGDRVGRVRLIDAWHSESPSRFITDNFGTYHQSAATSLLPNDATGATSLLTILTPPEAGGPKQGVPRDLESVPSELSALTEFAFQRATSLSVASMLFAPKLEVHSWQYGSSFNLVVGESVSDRILFWNARLLLPSWLDRDIYCLRVDPARLGDPEHLVAIGELIKHRNHVNAGSGGQPQLTIRSTSLTEAELDVAAERIRSTRPWSTVSVELVSSVDELIPSSADLERAKESSRFGESLFTRPDWVEFSWVPPAVHPPLLIPDHITDAPARQVFTLGLWATDFSFEHDGVSLRFGGQNRWALSRRWRMARAFNPKFAGSRGTSLPPPPRRSRGGRVTQFVGVDFPIQGIDVPTADRAFSHAFSWEGAYAKPDAEHGRVYPGAKARWVRASNEAGYLAGVLGMAGGLEAASDFLLHPFLAALFAKLGGTPKVSPSEIDPTLARLAKRSRRHPTFDLTDQQDRGALALNIIRAAKEARSPLSFVKYGELAREWRDYRAGLWEKEGRPPQPDDGYDWDAREQRSLDLSLIAMRQRQMLFQGHQWICRTCHHRNWVGIEQLRSELGCEVCSTVEPAPVAIEWLFRPNEFLIDSLRNHSVLSLVWALSALRDRSQYSFVYRGPSWFGLDSDSEEPDAEADLLVLSDGKAILCEVKSSWRGVRRPEFGSFVSLARRLRPDVALLAVMEDGSAIEDELRAATVLLAGEGIKFEILTPRDYALRDDVHLPEG